MNPDELRRWVSPTATASLPELDLELLDPADEDDRTLLIRAQHPEFAAAIDRGEDEIEVDGEPVNPRLHLLIHEVVANQLDADDPPEARQTAERLLAEGYDRHEALHMIGSAVAGELWSAQDRQEPVDPGDYVAALERLPGDWGAAAPGEPLSADDLQLNNEDIDTEDEEAFEEACEWLLSGHREWLSEREIDDDHWVAHQLLQLKWSYLDGHLGHWRVADLREVLLELFPRKVVVDDDDLAEVVPAAGRFLRYLADAGLLAVGSDPLPRLLEGLESLQAPFLESMRDPAKFGIAKSLFAGMAEAGVDPNDPGAMGAWIEEFNALPEEERKRRLPLPSSGRVVPQLPLPDDETLAARALATPAMRQLAGVVAWVGEGRALTQKGNLKLADGKALIGLLGTDDRFDEAIGDRTFKTTSTTELPGVDLVYRLALKARLARKYRGRVQPTKRGKALAERPLEVWRDVLLAMVDMGVIGAGRDDRYGLRFWEGYVEEGVVELLCMLAEVGSPVPVEGLANAAVDGLGEAYDLQSLPETVRSGLPESVARGVGRLVDRLVWLGAATRPGVRVERDKWGDERRVGGEFALTDLGRWFVRPMLLQRGHELPVVGELADAPAGTMLERVADWPPEAVHAEVRAWAAGRSKAAEEFAQVAREASTPDRRALAFEALEIIGDDAIPAVRSLVDDPHLRPWAQLWLVQRGEGEPQTFDPADAPAVFVQAFAMALLGGGAEAVAEMLADKTPVGEQVGLIEALWRVDDPYTAPVLEALAEVGDKKVAKAARKALFKHRTARSPASRSTRTRAP